MSRGGRPAFQAPILDALSRAGLRGAMAVIRLDGDTLVLSGDKGGALAVPAGKVERIRIVHFAGGRLPPGYETKIWRKGEAEPLLLMPPRPPAGYGRVVKSFAGKVAAAGGTVMRGPGTATAVVNLIVMGGSVSFLAAGMFLFAWFDGGWWWLPAAIAVALDLLLLRDLFANRWPRRIRSLDELDRELPAKEMER